MSAHTPGPWCLSPSGSYVRRTLHGFNIAEMNTELDEVRDNAKLIAAAPELAEALAGLLDVAGRYDGEGRFPGADSEIFEPARAALKKAGVL